MMKTWAMSSLNKITFNFMQVIIYKAIETQSIFQFGHMSSAMQT